MRKLLQQFLVCLLAGILLMPVLGKALHQWEAHEVVVSTTSGKHHLHTVQSDCSVCKYVQFSFLENFTLNIPTPDLTFPAIVPSFSSSIFQQEAFQLQSLRAPPVTA